MHLFVQSVLIQLSVPVVVLALAFVLWSACYKSCLVCVVCLRVADYLYSMIMCLLLYSYFWRPDSAQRSAAEACSAPVKLNRSSLINTLEKLCRQMWSHFSGYSMR